MLVSVRIPLRLRYRVRIDRPGAHGKDFCWTYSTTCIECGAWCRRLRVCISRTHIVRSREYVSGVWCVLCAMP